MASKKATPDMAVAFGDEFLADEILARLPTRCAVRCTVLSKRFRHLLVTSHFWLRQRRIGSPLELPHAARLWRHDEGKAFCFHVAGPTFAMEHTVKVEQGIWYASTCNGLVLVTGTSCHDKERSCVEGVLFNPATKEEVRLSLQLPHPGKEDVRRCILGFGYGPSSKVYKALIREANDNGTRLMVVSLGSSSIHEPRTIFSSEDEMDFNHSLHTPDGKVYFFMYPSYWYVNWDMLWVLAFDPDSEAVTRIAIPEGQGISRRMMLHVRGRPCIYTEKGHDTVLWLLTMDHRWEQLYILVNECFQPGDYLNGVWDCGGGLLFIEFGYSGVYMYNLDESSGNEKEDSSGSKLTAVSSLKIGYRWNNCPNNLWDYKATLISPASILDDVVFSERGREIVAPKP